MSSFCQRLQKTLWEQTGLGCSGNNPGTTKAPACNGSEPAGTPASLFTVTFYVFTSPRTVDQERNPYFKTDTLKLDWDLQLPTWTSQVPFGEKFYGQMRGRYLVRLSKPSNTVTTVKHEVGYIMLWGQWYWNIVQIMETLTLLKLFGLCLKPISVGVDIYFWF